MPTDYELAKAFFPGTRNELILHVDDLLESRQPENTKRIKISAIKLLGDGRKVGMPSDVGAAYDLLAKSDNHATKVDLGIEVLDMALSVYATDDSQRPMHLFHASKFTRVSIRTREAGDDTVSDINLHMTMYLRASTEAWDWLYKTQGEPVFIKWETNQKELPLNAEDDKQMKLGEAQVTPEQSAANVEQWEADRREATSKAHDAEFAGKSKSDGGRKLAAAGVN